MDIKKELENIIEANGYFISDFSDEQLEQIVTGLKNGLDNNQLRMYINNNFHEKQMEEIRLGLEHGLSEEDILMYAYQENFEELKTSDDWEKAIEEYEKENPTFYENKELGYPTHPYYKKFHSEQMKEIRLGLEHGLTHDQIQYYADKTFHSEQMEQIRLGFENNLSFDQIYTLGNANSIQMEIIRTAMMNGADEKTIEQLSEWHMDMYECFEYKKELDGYDGKWGTCNHSCDDKYIIKEGMKAHMTAEQIAFLIDYRNQTHLWVVPNCIVDHKEEMIELVDACFIAEEIADRFPDIAKCLHRDIPLKDIDRILTCGDDAKCSILLNAIGDGLMPKDQINNFLEPNIDTKSINDFFIKYKINLNYYDNLDVVECINNGRFSEISECAKMCYDNIEEYFDQKTFQILAHNLVEGMSLEQAIYNNKDNIDARLIPLDCLISINDQDDEIEKNNIKNKDLESIEI